MMPDHIEDHLIFPNDINDNVISQASNGDLRIDHYPHKSRQNRVYLGDIIWIINYLVYIAKSSKSRINKITFVKNEFMPLQWTYANSFVQNRFKNEEKENTPVSWDKLKDTFDSVMKNNEEKWRWSNFYWERYRHNYFWKTLEELIEIIDSPIELRCIIENDWTKDSRTSLYLDGYSMRDVLKVTQHNRHCWKQEALWFLLLNKDLPLLKAKKTWKKENLGSNNITHCLRGHSNNATQYEQSILACCKDKSLHAPHNLKVAWGTLSGKSPSHYDINMPEPMFEGSLKEWLEVMYTSKYYIGADTGISHLAEMINIPTLILYPGILHHALRGNYDEKGKFCSDKTSNQSWTNMYPNSKEAIISCEDDLCPVIDGFESHLDHWAWANSQTD